MDRNLLKNSWILAGLLLVINIILGLIMLSLVEFFKIGSSAMIGGAGIIGAMAVGQIYAMNFKEIMPKKIRFNVTIIYILAQMVIALLYILMLGTQNLLYLLLYLGILIIVSLIYTLIIYWLLGSGGKSYLKALEKRESIKNK